MRDFADVVYDKLCKLLVILVEKKVITFADSDEIFNDRTVIELIMEIQKREKKE